MPDKILVVDNDPKTLKVLKLRLENEGYYIITAMDGEQAWEAFEQHQPDLILLDVNMPGMSGLELLAQVKQKQWEIPVVVMTAYSSEQVAIEAIKKGANDYVTKPFHSREICLVVKENIERSRAAITRTQLLERFKSLSTDLMKRIKELEGSNRELIDSIAELERANIGLRELSIRDGLTKLYNHIYFQERLSEEFNRCQRYQTPLSFVMIDIDNFKEINDRFGHQEGDKVLVELAQLLMESIRGVDIAARYGGEEFVLILPQIDVEGARLMAERLCERVASHFAYHHNPQSLKVTISLGIAAIPHPKIKTKADLIRTADWALYQAKREGKNKVVVSE